MSLNKIKQYLGVTLLCAVLNLWNVYSMWGQEVRVLPSLEKNEILIGEQVNLKVRVVHDRSMKVRLVLPQDTLVSGVEVLDFRMVDSLEVNDRLKEAVYNVVLTSFDSAMYVLDNINVLVQDSVFTALEKPTLLVNTIPVDLEHPEQFNDIKAEWKTPFVWKDYVAPALIVLLILLLVYLAYRLWLYLRRRKDESSQAVPSIPLMTPYDEAIEGLYALKAKELWQKNQVKEYYTELTDILRTYILRVHGIATWDRTSSEILETFRSQVDTGSSYEALHRILTMADLAKFAKYKPDVQDNIGILHLAETFVEQQKPQSEDAEHENTSKSTTI